jgi:hypothetical protein
MSTPTRFSGSAIVRDYCTENARLKTERLQQRVAAEFKLPDALAARLRLPE